jgi:hypothetical protein
LELEALLARLAALESRTQARDERIELLEEENRWLKAQLFGRSSVPLDNNRCENAIRPFVVGRKGWMFSDTVKGAIASANLYSLVETAKANGVEPHAYLSTLFERLPYAKSVEDFEAVLPWKL